MCAGFALAASGFVFVSASALADDGPSIASRRVDPVSISRTSPSVGHGANPNDIYAYIPQQGDADGYDVPNGGGPDVHVLGSNLGVTLGDNIDAVSTNEYSPVVTDRAIVDLDLTYSQTVNGQTTYPNADRFWLYFSVDANSVGAVGSAVQHQQVRHQGAGDRFGTKVSQSPALTFANPSTTQTHATATGTTNFLSFNQTFYNLMPSIAPDEYNTSGVQDDADAMEIVDLDYVYPVDHMQDERVFLSLDAASPTLGSTYSPADILTVPANASTLTRFAQASALGLSATNDELDALVVWDMNNNGVGDAGIDWVLFSLAPGSPLLSTHNLSAADIFVSNLTGINKLYLSYNSMGLLKSDNIDAIDSYPVFAQYNTITIDVPEPATAALMVLASASLLIRRRRSAC
jgi:hypothetical protein